MKRAVTRALSHAFCFLAPRTGVLRFNPVRKDRMERDEAYRMRSHSEMTGARQEPVRSECGLALIVRNAERSVLFDGKDMERDGGLREQLGNETRRKIRADETQPGGCMDQRRQSTTMVLTALRN